MRGPYRALMIMLIGLAAAHLVFAAAQPEPVPFGDETHYQKVVQRDLRDGQLSLLPGGLRPAMRTELSARVWSHVAEPGIEGARLIARATRLNLVFFLVVVAGTFFQGRALGLSGWGAFAAAALLALFPWFGFHVHTLWPEMLHAALVTIGLLALFQYVRVPRIDLLAVVGVCFGLAQLTKSALAPFCWLALVAVGVVTYARSGDLPQGRRVGRALIAAGVLAGVLALVLVPQMRANAQAGFGFGLGANRWWNIELAVRTPASVADDVEHGLGQWRRQRAITDEYFAASTSPLQREQLSRERTLRYVREQGVLAVAAAQARKLAQVLRASPSLAFYRQPVLAQALGYRARWGAAPPAWIAALAAPARPVWYALLVLGLAGLALRARRDRTWVVPLAFVLSGLVLVALVPIKFRFLLPVVPVLCLGVAAAAEAVQRRQSPSV